MSNQLVSIITICYNAENDIRKTIESVVKQSYNDYQFIIIDGGSVDKTDEIIKSYLSYVDVYISEPDLGIYDAMNKGVKYATGNWLIFMNSGDIFFDKDVLRKVFIKGVSYDIDIISGRVIYDDGTVFIPKYDRCLWLKNTLHHQGTFYRNKNISYNIKWKILADYDVNLCLYRKNKKCMIIKDNIAICSTGGISQVPVYSKYREEIDIKKQYLKGWILFIVMVLINIKYIIRLWKK